MKNALIALTLTLQTMLASTVFAGILPASSKLYGAWKLDQFTMFADNGSSEPFCTGASGSIVYDASGTVSVAINCAPHSADGSEEPADAYGRLLFYAGKFDLTHNLITHHISNASSTNLIGKDLVRKAEILTDKKLVLTGALGKGQSLRISWTRMTPAQAKAIHR